MWPIPAVTRLVDRVGSETCKRRVLNNIGDSLRNLGVRGRQIDVVDDLITFVANEAKMFERSRPTHGRNSIPRAPIARKYASCVSITG